MSNVLILVEQIHGSLRKSSLSALSFGRQVASKTSGQLVAVLIGKAVQDAAAEVARCGVDKVLTVEAADLEHYLVEGFVPALLAAQQAADAKVIGAAASSISKDLLPRLASRLQAGMASDVMAVVDADTFERPMWAGNVVATVKITSPVKVCTVRGTDFAMPKTDAAPAPVQAVAVQLDKAAWRTEFIGLKEVKSERPDVTTAERIVSGGRGVKGAEGFRVIEALADTLHAGVGASRAVCDAGWVPNDLQIGQTGKIVAPNLYVAVGISGAIQHLAGMKGSKTIVAINKDPDAPIFQVADYGLVADLFEALPEMNRSLKG